LGKQRVIRGNREGASPRPLERSEKAPSIQSSTVIAQSSQKRQTDDETLRKNPGYLVIDNADPSPRALSARMKILKYHDPNPKDGIPPQANHIMFAWLPNAAWVGDNLSGYVFSVDGSKKPINIGSSGERRLVSPSTPVIPDMFHPDKMMYGMLCIRLPNTKKNQLDLNPIDSLELYAEKDMDHMLRSTIKDDIDLSGEGSYAGFYISEDPTREWERNGWIVVSTGDIDISRTIHEYLKGDYNPYCSEDKRSLKTIVNEMKEILEQMKRVSEKESLRSSPSPRQLPSPGKHEEMRKVKRKGNSVKEGGEMEDEIIDDMVLSRGSSERSSSLKTGKKKLEKKRRKSKKRSEHLGRTESSSRDSGKKNVHKSTTERLVSAQLPEEERCAWKYSKLIKEIHRLIQVHATNAASKCDSTPDMFLGGYKGEPECVKHRNMKWEEHLMKESFIEGMVLRMKEKRWLVASKLAGILGFDLSKDFDINPFDKNIDNHRNVIHVTTNTFSQNRRTAKMVYYSGAFCKHEMEGGLPVPISPLQGIHILKGPPKHGEFTGKGKFQKTGKLHKKGKETNWSSTHCISDQRFRFTKTNDEKARVNPPVNKRKERKPRYDSSEDETSSSFDSDPDSDSDSEDQPMYSTTPIYGGEDLRVFKLCSYTTVDDDDDLGGRWLLNKESRMSIDCKGAFPYGTGRAMAYLRTPPPPPPLSGTLGKEKEENQQYEKKIQRMFSGGRLPEDIVPTSEWGPRGVWVIGGSDGIRARQGRRTLFTWGDTDYPTHPRLARGIFRDRVKGFQTRETHMGWNPTFGSLVLQPKAIVLHSPINPLK